MPTILETLGKISHDPWTAYIAPPPQEEEPPTKAPASDNTSYKDAMHKAARLLESMESLFPKKHTDRSQYHKLPSYAPLQLTQAKAPNLIQKTSNYMGSMMSRLDASWKRDAAVFLSHRNLNGKNCNQLLTNRNFFFNTYNQTICNTPVMDCSDGACKPTGSLKDLTPSQQKTVRENDLSVRSYAYRTPNGEAVQNNLIVIGMSKKPKDGSYCPPTPPFPHKLNYWIEMPESDQPFPISTSQKKTDKVTNMQIKKKIQPGLYLVSATKNQSELLAKVNQAVQQAVITPLSPDSNMDTVIVLGVDRNSRIVPKVTLLYGLSQTIHETKEASSTKEIVKTVEEGVYALCSSISIPTDFGQRHEAPAVILGVHPHPDRSGDDSICKPLQEYIDRQEMDIGNSPKQKLNI